jgi:protein-disulfide isomerase
MRMRTTLSWNRGTRWCAYVVLALCACWLVVQPAAGSPHQHSRAARAAPASGQHSVLQILRGIPQSGERLGRSTAPLVVTLYGDLECPACRDFVLSRAFAGLISNDVQTGKARIVYRSLCTETCNGPGRHVFVSQQVAAYAAGAQKHFWQYAMLFLQQQGAEGTNYATNAFLDRLAREVPGLEFVRWLAERKNPALAGKVRTEDQTAIRRNIVGTPTLTVAGPNGMKQLENGVPSFKQINAALTAVS